MSDEVSERVEAGLVRFGTRFTFTLLGDGEIFILDGQLRVGRAGRVWEHAFLRQM